MLPNSSNKLIYRNLFLNVTVANIHFEVSLVPKPSDMRGSTVYVQYNIKLKRIPVQICIMIDGFNTKFVNES